jgi:tetratricopeptide (TPR) repeat protein
MEVFTNPILIALAVLFGSAAVIDSPAIYVASLGIPEPLVLAGHSPEALQERTADRIRELERKALARPHARALALESEEGLIETAAEQIDVMPLLRAIQEAAGFIEYVADGHVFIENDRLVLRLNVTSRTGGSVTTSLSRPQGDMAGLIDDAAKFVMSVTEPYLLCAALLRTAIDAHSSIDDAERCVAEALADPDRRQRVWLHNLAGVIHFLRGDQAAALGKFRRSVEIDRDFSPALLNIGVVYALNGWHDEAIKFFRHVFSTPTLGESPQTYAATRVEWARSLVTLGRRSEAEAMLAAAAQADPWYAATFLCWAEIAVPEARVAQLRSHGQLVARQAEQIFTENLVGVIRHRGTAQTAANDNHDVPLATCS